MSRLEIPVYICQLSYIILDRDTWKPRKKEKQQCYTQDKIYNKINSQLIELTYCDYKLSKFY